MTSPPGKNNLASGLGLQGAASNEPSVTLREGFGVTGGGAVTS